MVKCRLALSARRISCRKLMIPNTSFTRKLMKKELINLYSLVCSKINALLNSKDNISMSKNSREKPWLNSPDLENNWNMRWTNVSTHKMKSSITCPKA